MLSRGGKIQIVNKLSSLFNTYNELSLLCKELGNNPDEVKNALSKIIKYGFVKGDFLFSNYSLTRIYHDLDGIQKRYDEYVENSNKGLFPFFGSKKKKKRLKKEEEIRRKIPYSIDEDIILSDVEGLEFPEAEWIESICNDNRRILELEKKKSQKKKEFYSDQRGFDETAFYYRRNELVLIDSNFVYQNEELVGSVYEDYRTLYSGERYAGNFSKTSPLNNSFEDNLKNIRRANDISFRKRGNVYEIENGRHRVVYLIRNGVPVYIPANVARRIEDREFNQRLIKIKNSHDIEIYKNNILNDDPDILIEYNETLYRVVGNEGVRQFEEGINNNSLEQFECIPFKRTNDDLEKKKYYKEKYKMLIIRRVIDEGESLLQGNFSDFIKFYKDEFDSINMPIFFNMYEELQKEYNHSKVFGYDFLESKKEEFDVRFGKTIEEMEEEYK